MTPPLTYSPKHPSPNIGGYRYFFNGQEADNEMFGELANFGYEFRQYDSRLARWWSVDPKWSEYPGVSPFVFCNGSPIMMADLKGEEAWEPDKNGNLKAQQGDNAYSLAEYLNTTPDIAIRMLEEQNYTINANGVLNLKVGDIFNVDYGTSQKNMDFIGTIGEIISHQSHLGLGEDIFRNYWFGIDNFELSGAQFAGILMYMKNNTIEILNEESVILKGESGKTYPGISKLVNFYGSPYERTFGKATLYYNTKGNVVGFYDKYDFDSKPWGNRSFWNEIITRSVNIASPKHSSPVNVRYGYSKRK